MDKVDINCCYSTGTNCWCSDHNQRVLQNKQRIHDNVGSSRCACLKKYVIEDRFAKQLNGQICEGTVAQIKYKLMCAEISKKNESEAKSSLDAAIAGINYDAIRAEQEQKFQAALQGGEYAAIIKVFNCKDISTSIGHFFEIDNKAYCSLVIALLHGDKHDDIVNALVPYLPTDIPR